MLWSRVFTLTARRNSTFMKGVSLSASHTGSTHGPRTEKVAILASASSCAGCASPCATRALSALDQRCAFVVVRCVRRKFLCMHKTVRGARRMNALARRTPAMRRTRWTNARHTRGTRGAHAGHALCVRRLRSSARIARCGRTSSVLLTHVQRAQRSSGVFLACVWRAYRVWPGII